MLEQLEVPLLERILDDFLCLSIVGSVTIHTYFLTYTYRHTYICSYFGVQSTGGGLGHSPW